MAICEADGKEYWAYSGIHNEDSKPYKNNKKKENLSNVVFELNDELKQFITLDITTEKGTWNRKVDAEAKLFEFLATQNNKIAFIVVDLDMCDSCKEVLQQFKDKYPETKIHIVQKNLAKR